MVLKLPTWKSVSPEESFTVNDQRVTKLVLFAFIGAGPVREGGESPPHVHLIIVQEA